MRSLIFDTDVLSTFGKIRRLDLLRKLLPGKKFFIPTSVYNELFKAKDCGYEFVDYIMSVSIPSSILRASPLIRPKPQILHLKGVP